MLSFAGKTEATAAAAFLAQNWQKQTLWAPGGADLSALPVMEPDELAWLATQDDVESRLIVTERTGGKVRYRMSAGPFSADELEALPERDWTLLVQDVEKHLPELRAWFDLVPFIPDWRFDDLMISVAAPGGSVGPHVDNYDVFLIQSLGIRRWHWTTEATPADPEASTDLSLVEEFEPQDSRSATPGDVLYLPPGVAHHGIAEDLCVTCSIGMRAPQLSDLEASSGTNDAFYTDPDLQLSEVRCGYISRRAAARATALLAEHGLPGDQAEQMLGCYATRPKEWLQPPFIEKAAAFDGSLEMHGMARLAWSDTKVFANGAWHDLGGATPSLLEALCATRRAEVTDFDAWRADDANRYLLDWLWRRGIFDPDATIGRET